MRISLRESSDLSARFVSPSFHPFRFLIDSVLMEDQLCGAPCEIGHECELCIDLFEEEVALRFGGQFELRLAGGLDEETIVLARDGEDECWRELIAAGVALQDCGIH